ncbi:MAG: hypothetical protein ACRYG4_22405 [Janthinobacterium lividum]
MFMAVLSLSDSSPTVDHFPFARGPVQAVQQLARYTRHCGMQVVRLTIRPDNTADLYLNMNQYSKFKQVDCMFRGVQNVQRRGSELDLFFVGNAAVSRDSK